jgi:CBS domain-containing protein
MNSMAMNIEPRGESIRKVMTPDPITVALTATLEQAACRMRDAGIGNVVVLDGEKIMGILTDRDIVVRAVAEGRDPAQTPVSEIASQELTTLAPDDTIDEAVTLMRERSIRRLPVVERGRPVGIVSLGDLALERDPDSCLGDISAAPPNA